MHEVQCDLCGQKIKVTPSRYKNRVNFYCSKKCEAQDRINKNKSKVLCECVYCGKNLRIKKSAYQSRKRGICCSRDCAARIRSKWYSGRKNPNCRYRFDDHFFSVIDSSSKAYLLGWIASDGHVSKSGFTIAIHVRDQEILANMRDVICKDLPIKNQKSNKVSLTVNSKQMSSDICRLLRIDPDQPKDRSVAFPDIDINLSLSFILGLFDGDGTIRTTESQRRYNYLDCGIASYSSRMKLAVYKNTGVKCRITDKGIYWSGTNAMRFLDLIYMNATTCLRRKHNRYLEWKKILQEK